MAGQSKAINFFYQALCIPIYPALFFTGNFLPKPLFKNSKTWKLIGFSKVFHMPKVTPEIIKFAKFLYFDF
jgi:hypothetical protein